MAKRDNQRTPGYRQMTVVHIREQPDADYVEIVFMESARFYKLYRNNPHFGQALERLRAALAAGDGVDVGLTEPHGDVIQIIGVGDDDCG